VVAVVGALLAAAVVAGDPSEVGEVGSLSQAATVTMMMSAMASAHTEANLIGRSFLAAFIDQRTGGYTGLYPHLGRSERGGAAIKPGNMTLIDRTVMRLFTRPLYGAV
jgi:hypothetical protein